MTDFTSLPDNLPVPTADGAADHLTRRLMPTLVLTATDGASVDLGARGPGRTIVYLYPQTGRPGVDLPEGWDDIPGARGCSTEACDFRNHFDELRESGAARVFVSSQSVAYQSELVARLRLPFAMVSDETLALAELLNLPTFVALGEIRLYSRLTLIVLENSIEHVFYPISPPEYPRPPGARMAEEQSSSSLTEGHSRQSKTGLRCSGDLLLATAPAILLNLGSANPQRGGTRRGALLRDAHL